MLRAGSAVVGLWNDAFDLDGIPPLEGTTASGVQRILKADSSPSSQTASVRGVNHE
jgi:type IV secretion system protein VirB9